MDANTKPFSERQVWERLLAERSAMRVRVKTSEPRPKARRSTAPALRYARNNRDKINARRRERYATDPQYRILACLRARLTTAFRRGRATKRWNTMQLTGCTLEHLIEHLSAKFTEGMTLDNYGEWEIDHIKPCVSFDLEDAEQVRACFHYTNLQPLWSLDNAAKRTTDLNLIRAE